MKTSATPLAAILLLLPLAAAGCNSGLIVLPAEPPQWTAKPARCVTVAGSEIHVQPGRLSPSGFTWANSEIQFKVFESSASPFKLVFYDTAYGAVRKANASKWFNLGDRRAVSMADDPSMAVYPVHALWLGGDGQLTEKGVRAFGGTVTVKMDPTGLPRADQPSVVLSEAVKIGQWNEIRIRIEQGAITVWVNGERGLSIPGEATIDGPFAIEVHRGTLKLSDIKLTKL